MNTVNGIPFAFSAQQSAEENCATLQAVLDKGEEILVTDPGTYNVCRALLIGSNTRLYLAPGAVLNRTGEEGRYLFINRGAYTKTWDENITVQGLHFLCNELGQTPMPGQVMGLIAQDSFHCVRNLVVEDFTCLDVPALSYCLQVCSFTDLRISNAHIEGKKDAVHLGSGKRFLVENCVFRTFDDPIALNSKDYSTCQPEMNWLEDGEIRNCTELDQPLTTGYFCRMTGGSWLDWQPGMQVQNSDLVVSEGRIYTQFSAPDGTLRTSTCRPTHEKGIVTYPDGVTWSVLQESTLHSCGCRNIRFSGVRMDKNREVGFCLSYGRDAWERSCYEGSRPEEFGEIVIEDAENTRSQVYFLWSITPGRRLVFRRCTFRACRVHLAVLDEVSKYYPPTEVVFENCTFDAPDEQLILSGDPRRLSRNASHRRYMPANGR